MSETNFPGWEELLAIWNYCFICNQQEPMIDMSRYPLIQHKEICYECAVVTSD